MFADNRSSYAQQTNLGTTAGAVDRDLFTQFLHDSGSPSLREPAITSQHRALSQQQLQQQGVNSLYTSPQFISQFDLQQLQQQTSSQAFQQPLLQQSQSTAFIPGYARKDADQLTYTQAGVTTMNYPAQASDSGQQFLASPNPYIRPASAGANYPPPTSASMVSAISQPSNMPSYAMFSNYANQPNSAPPVQQHFPQGQCPGSQTFLSPPMNSQLSPAMATQHCMSPQLGSTVLLSPPVSALPPYNTAVLTSPTQYGLMGQPQSTPQQSDGSQYDNEVTLTQDNIEQSTQRGILGLNVFADNGTSLDAGQFMPYPAQVLPMDMAPGQLNLNAVHMSATQQHTSCDGSDASDGGAARAASPRPMSPVSPRLKQNNGAYTNLSKAFVQYVPASSPAATRNRKNLAIQTDASGKASKKLVAVKLETTRIRPTLSPPLSHAATMGNGQSRKRSAPGQSVSPYQSPHLESPPSPTRQYDMYSTAGNMPSFALSVEQMHGSDTGVEAYTSTMDNDRLYAELRLQAPRMQAGTSASSNGSLLSPPLPSATSMSSGYSTGSQQGFAASPGFERRDPFDQTLVGLTLDKADPFLQHTQIATQHSYVMSSPTKLPHLTSPASRGTSSWSDLSQPLGMPQAANVNIFTHDVQLEQPVIFDSSPVKGTIFAPLSGHHHSRILSSPQRLRTMQSAPDLTDMYENEAPLAIRSPRKASAKRRREPEASSPDDNGFDSPPDQDTSYDDDADDDYGQRKTSKRRASVSHNVLKPKVSIQSFNIMGGGGRLKPGPKPKNSLPDLQAARQTSFYIDKKAPPMPALPAYYAQAGITTSLAVLPSADSPPEFEGPLSKDTLATYYAVQPDGPASKKGKPQKLYTCLVDGCGKEFPRKSAVESHIQTHMEDKPFACKHPDW